MNRLPIIVVSVVLMVTAAPASAKGGRSGGGSVSVHSYTRSNGTYVQGHTRSRPGTSTSYRSGSSYYSPQSGEVYGSQDSTEQPKHIPPPDDPPPVSGQKMTVVRNRAGEIVYMGNHSPPASIAGGGKAPAHRSTAAKDAFKREHPCPATGSSKGACPGYVIDHVQPLKRRGADRPENMQWQTKEEAKAKDKWE